MYSTDPEQSHLTSQHPLGYVALPHLHRAPKYQMINPAAGRWAATAKP
ncbi:hypothetical protein SAMN05216338_100181 [Bradyrhizobium sp. Rc2d]|nr:hypothetical protein SAMN05216338_100181 [Bradyrhizobium sp. Rc2d]